ncbi:MAG: hypothetical protein HY049_16280 [Acidobacteria bacterium]|nr:hypothetical protein [Acidobacteriota bacterium]
MAPGHVSPSQHARNQRARLTLLVVLLELGVLFVPARAEVTLQGTVGFVDLDNSTFETSDDSLLLGIGVDAGAPSSPVRIEGSFRNLGNSTGDLLRRVVVGTSSRPDSTIDELAVGAVYTFWKHAGTKAFAGAGAALLRARETHLWFSRSVTDRSPGRYVHAGLLRDFRSGWSFGADIRKVFGTDIQFRRGVARGGAGDIDQTQVTFLTAWRIP